MAPALYIRWCHFHFIIKRHFQTKRISRHLIVRIGFSIVLAISTVPEI